MTTHLYCVLPHHFRGAIPHGLSGVAGARVRALPVEQRLVAWVSDAARAANASLDDIREHNDVVEAAMETGTTPVPARYGQRFDDDDACRAALASRSTSVERLIETMQGFVEMTVLITPSTRRMIRDLDPVIPEMLDTVDTTGRRYLDTLRKREARSGEISEATDDLSRELGRVAEPYVVRTIAHHTITPMPLRTTSHLVAREHVAAYRQAIESVPNIGDYRYLLIGPRAPYSFCALRADTGGAHGMNLAD